MENLLNEAAILAAKENACLSQTGRYPDKHLSKWVSEQRRRAALFLKKREGLLLIHEAGHAILFHVLPDVGPVYSVSIIPTGRVQADIRCRFRRRTRCLIQKGKMLQDITVALGGRVAEEEIFDDITTGASQDIKQATAYRKIHGYEVWYV